MMIYYQNCQCYSWPLVGATPVGRCGRCGTRPEGPTFTNKEDAVAQYIKDHGHPPKKI